jgi:phospholipid transport system substrate-binding protein
MNSKYAVIALLLFASAATVPAAPASPDQVIRQTTENVLKMVRDPELQGDAKTAERRTAMIREVDQVFDWDLMARLSMGKYWRGLKKSQQEEFVPLFKELIVSSYLGHVESYSGEEIVYEEPIIDLEKGSADVKATVNTEAYGKVELLYRLYSKGDEWRVRDVYVLGVSLVRNYRTQLNQLMSRHDFKEVMDRLKEKVDEQRETGGVSLK